MADKTLNVTIRPWLWIPSTEVHVPSQWELEVTWNGIGGMVWSKSVKVYGPRPSDELTEDLTRILLKGIKHGD